MMKLKNFFNILLFCFILIVPLVPIKIKVSRIPLSPDMIIGGFLILLGLVYLIYNERKNKRLFSVFKEWDFKTITGFIVFFALMAMFSITYAEDKVSVITEGMRFFEYVFIFYLIVMTADKTTIKRVMTLFYFTMLFAAVFGIAQFVLNLSPFKDIRVFGRGRVYATFVNPDYWGAAVNAVIFYPIISLMEDRKNKSAIYMNIFAIIVLAFNLVFTFTRGSWLGFFVGLAVIALIRYRKALLALPAALVVGLVLPFTRSRLLSMLSLKQSTAMRRLRLWKMAWIMFKEHFWTGVGNGNYTYRYPGYLKKYPKLNAGEGLTSAHNSYLKTFAELGIFGGIAFVVIYLMMFVLSFRSYTRTQDKFTKVASLSFMGFLGAYYFQNFFNNLIFIPQLNVFVWILAACIYKLYRIEREEREIGKHK